MALESTRSKEIYRANGSTREWPVPFAYSRTEDIQLIHTDSAGREHPVTTNFKVKIGEMDETSVVYPLTGDPVPSGELVTVYRVTPLTQIVDLIYGGAFSPEVLEKDGFDRLEMQIQELSEKADRAISLDISSDMSSEELLDEIFGTADRAEDAADRAEKAADESCLESGVYNAEAAFSFPDPVLSGTVITMPVHYYPQRNVLSLNYAGFDCFRSEIGLGGYQYEEVGDDPNVLSNQVRVLFDVQPGEQFHAWVVTSALGKNIEQIEELAEQTAINSATATSAAENARVSEILATTAAREAELSASGASDSAELARKWAVHSEDEPVLPDEYSAYHWARKALENTSGKNVVSKINGLEPDADKNIQLTREVTQAEYDALQAADGLSPGAEYLITDGVNASSLIVIGAAGTAYPVNAAPYLLCEFYQFRHPILRPGFQPAQGGLLENAAMLYPDAWAYLQTVEGQLLCKTEAEWKAMTTAVWFTDVKGGKVGWNGIGGAPFYVQDLAAGTLRLPDIRGMYAENAGYDALNVGGVHGDGIRKIVGSVSRRNFFNNDGGNGSGAFYTANPVSGGVAGGSSALGMSYLRLDSSYAVPNANKNQPRAYGALPCVYLGVSR